MKELSCHMFINTDEIIFTCFLVSSNMETNNIIRTLGLCLLNNYSWSSCQPVQMHSGPCWSWLCEVEPGDFPVPAGCSCGAPLSPHRGADARPSTSFSFPKVSSEIEREVLNFLQWWLQCPRTKKDACLLFPDSLYQSSDLATPPPCFWLSAPSLCVSASQNGTEPGTFLLPLLPLKHTDKAFLANRLGR